MIYTVQYYVQRRSRRPLFSRHFRQKPHRHNGPLHVRSAYSGFESSLMLSFQHSASARRDHIRDQCDSLTKEVTNKRQLLLSDLDYEETSKSDRLQRLTASARHATATLRDAARQHSQLLEQNEDPIRFIQVMPRYPQPDNCLLYYFIFFVLLLLLLLFFFFFFRQ